MAYVVPYSFPEAGMTRFLNVEHRVGPNKDCPNVPNDVEAVQRLIALGYRNYAGSRGFALPVPTGRFDPTTGFYIYMVQQEARGGSRGTVIDGTISPAKGVSYGGGIWTILDFNLNAFSNSRAEWEALLAKYPARAS